MAITNYEEMSITSPAFNTVREAFDVALQRLLKKMEKSKMDEGQIALNITVTNEDVFTDDDAELGDTDGPEKKPVLKYKITTTVPIKDTDDGKADTGMALVWDKDLGRYVLVYMQTNQTSMYDNPPAGAPQQTTMNPAQQIGQGSGALIDIRAFRPDDDGKADTGMALVWDKDLGRYVLVYMQTNQTSMYDNPPAGAPQQTTMNPAQQIGQGSGALIDIRAFRPDDDSDDE